MLCYTSETDVEPGPIAVDDLRPVHLEPGRGRPLAAPVGLGRRRAGPEQGAAPEVQERPGRRVQEGIRNSET